MKGITLHLVPEATRPVVNLVYMAPMEVMGARFQLALYVWEWGVN